MGGHAPISLFWLSCLPRSEISQVQCLLKERSNFFCPWGSHWPSFLKNQHHCRYCRCKGTKTLRKKKKKRCYRMHCDSECCRPVLEVEYLSWASQHQCCLTNTNPAVPFCYWYCIWVPILWFGACSLFAWLVCVCVCFFSLMSTIWLWKLLGIFDLRKSFCHPWAYSCKLYFQVLKLSNLNISPPKFPIGTLVSVSNTRYSSIPAPNFRVTYDFLIAPSKEKIDKC